MVLVLQSKGESVSSLRQFAGTTDSLRLVFVRHAPQKFWFQTDLPEMVREENQHDQTRTV